MFFLNSRDVCSMYDFFQARSFFKACLGLVKAKLFPSAALELHDLILVILSLEWSLFFSN